MTFPVMPNRKINIPNVNNNNNVQPNQIEKPKLNNKTENIATKNNFSMAKLKIDFKDYNRSIENANSDNGSSKSPFNGRNNPKNNLSSSPKVKSPISNNEASIEIMIYAHYDKYKSNIDIRKWNIDEEIDLTDDNNKFLNTRNSVQIKKQFGLAAELISIPDNKTFQQFLKIFIIKEFTRIMSSVINDENALSEMQNIIVESIKLIKYKIKNKNYNTENLTKATNLYSKKIMYIITKCSGNIEYQNDVNFIYLKFALESMIVENKKEIVNICSFIKDFDRNTVWKNWIEDSKINDVEKHMRTSIIDGLKKCNPNETCLKLPNNNITYFPECFFAPFPKLRSLFLNNNRLTELNNYVLAYLYHLENIDLSYNNFEKFDGEIFDCIDISSSSKITTINLAYNQITRINNMKKSLSQLRCFDASNNRLTKIDADYSQLSNVEKFDFSYNQISDIKEKSFIENTKLSSIHLNSNQLGKAKDKDFLKHFSSNNDSLISINMLNNNLNTNSYNKLQDQYKDAIFLIF